MTENGFFALEHVSKRFGVVQALDDVSLKFRPGELLALVGENGAGKSTMMRILEGVFKPDSGSVRFADAPVVFSEPRDSHNAGIRVIHQEPEIVPSLTIAENIFIGEMPRTAGVFLDWKTLEAQTARVLAAFGTQGDMRPRQPCETLGPAQRQMIEIMRAVRAGGRLIAFDEPTSSLTNDEARRLFAVIRRLRAEGTSIVYISHRLNEIIELADRIVVLRDGRLVDDSAAAGATEQGIARLMVGRDIADLFKRESRPSGENLLEIKGLTTERITGIDLSVRKGEVLGIAGLMGAGRSELAKAIVGYDRRLGGTVSMNGIPVPPDSPHAAIVAGIGFAPEDRKHEALLMFRSILDNAALCVADRTSSFGLFSRRKALDVVSPLAAKMAIKAPDLDVPVAKLSGGNQQKVVLARWLARQPMLLILDEPTRGIDIGAKAEIYRLIEELAAGGIGLILISSEMPELIGLADRVLVMAEGRITAELNRPHIDETSILRHAMPRPALQREGLAP
ncbi:sugar ABC transporter ATP-binding protein [Mesorhizobium sp. ESP-6-2]|uniref:sugar ABC transporter ATP-binding protein n=2 Tax=unclassified Mesorhizobium TaxID=325217 RepID=UPI0011295E33|nr:MULTISPECIES: sugar ABC transporter ATP-binding protein [unclassified Mesorhizobium]MBZ9811234.1 sugar ABC transporter ATP-binding protein [Mesorhizobium sp. ESP-6-2]TPM25811.1 sugar ABC transporter ATP-binding protein [Mesorhizobium sp. B2-2-2]